MISRIVIDTLVSSDGSVEIVGFHTSPLVRIKNLKFPYHSTVEFETTWDIPTKEKK